MQINDLLMEKVRLQKKVLVVDVQPAYDKVCRRILHDLIPMMNRNPSQFIVMFNSEDYSQDTKGDVVMYYLENGLTEEAHEQITWVEKYYAFFRDWMDHGASDQLIIKVLRKLVISKLYSIEDLDLMNFLGDEYEPWMKYSSLYLPDIDVAFLKEISPFYLCGGGRNECLKEIQILCNVFNIKYKLIEHLIY